MKRFTATAVALLLLFTGCSTYVPNPEECALCDTFPRHAPCLVDINSGELRELEIYQPHHTKIAELSDEQHGGYMSLVQVGDIRGILLGADRVELKAPAKAKGIQDALFCKACRKLLRDNKCQGYILADLRDPATPSVWQIDDGISFSVRCYEINITAPNNGEGLLIVMKGTLSAN